VSNRLKKIIVFSIAAALLQMYQGPLLASDSVSATVQSEKAGEGHSMKLPIAQESAETEILVYGTAAPFQTVDISSKVAGNIDFLPFLEGDSIKTGEILFKIDKVDYELQVNAAKTQVDRAKVALDQASLEYQRAVELVKSNSTSVQARDNANFARLAAQASLSAADAALKIAENTLKNTQMIAPMNGVIATKYREIGDFIDKGKPVLQLVNLDQIKAKLRVPELLVSKIKKGDKIEITVDSYEADTFTGVIYEIKPVGDALTHFFEITAIIKNPAQKLKAGMFLKAKIKTGDK